MSQPNENEPATPETLPLPPGYARPSVEEFVASGYPAEGYEEFFAKHEAGLREKLARGELPPPAFFLVHSRVRHQSTRTQRARSPVRHKFKQYLFSNPSLRLVRKRPLRVPGAAVAQYIDELIAKEAAGLLVVTTLDGRKVDLSALKGGSLQVGPAVVAAPPPHPPLDSIANDVPWGQPLPQYVDGTFYGDPVADRALNELVREKREEAEDAEAEAAAGAGDPAVDAPEESAPVDTAPEDEVTAIVEPAVMEELAKSPEASPESPEDFSDPAAERASEKKGKKGRK